MNVIATSLTGSPTQYFIFLARPHPGEVRGTVIVSDGAASRRTDDERALFEAFADTFGQDAFATLCQLAPEERQFVVFQGKMADGYVHVQWLRPGGPGANRSYGYAFDTSSPFLVECLSRLSAGEPFPP